VRLNKILSSAGVASRRLADELIRQGRVEVNGRVVNTVGSQADPTCDEIRVDGRRLSRTAPARRYLLLNKPRGVVSTRSDPQRRRTVLDLAALAGIGGYLYPVGRLDFDSEGLLILTNDGAFAERVSHPRYALERTYEVEVDGVPDARDLSRLRRGIRLDERMTQPARVRVLAAIPARGGRTLLEMTLREGRNRQVRRMCDAIAHPARRLRRTRIGGVSDQRLRSGQVRDLTPAEIRRLFGDAGNQVGARKPGFLQHPGNPVSSVRHARGSRRRNNEE
jgi:pseudouridine synthase